MSGRTARSLRLLCILAHPDDEPLGVGRILAKYAAEGVATYLVTATRGEKGWFGPPEENPGPTELGKIREGELKEAAKVLGLREVNLLDYHDGELDKAKQGPFVQQLVGHIRRIRPHVVVTFDQNGVYGHPTISPLRALRQPPSWPPQLRGSRSRAGWPPTRSRSSTTSHGRTK